MMDRQSILARFRDMVARGEPIVGGGAGTGLSAKCEEAGGIDLIVIYNSGRYRMAGRGSLAGLMPYGDANAIVVEMAAEVLPVARKTPVLAGVCATDPFRLMDRFLDDLKRIGFAGVQNFPTVGLIDGTFRANLEETGMGYGLEVDMIRTAREKDMLTTPYVFDAESAAAMAEAGVVAVSLPLATLYLDEEPVPAAALHDAGVPVAVATDFNPGTAPSYHLHLALLLACLNQHMTPQQALAGATVHAARAVGLETDHGRLEPGCVADLAILDSPDINHWLYHFRPNAAVATYVQGKRWPT